MNNKALAILVLAGMVALMLSMVNQEHPAGVRKTNGSYGTIESTGWKLFLRDRPLPESCINVHRDSGQRRVSIAAWLPGKEKA